MMLDPGKTTGIATSDTFGVVTFEAPMAEAGECIEKWCKIVRHGSICWEAFTITPVTYRMPEASTAIEMIGIARYFALKYRITIIPARARQARSACPPVMLKALGLHHPGKPHANDAARHLVAQMISAGTLPKAYHDILSSWIQERGDVNAVRGAAGGGSPED